MSANLSRLNTCTWFSDNAKSLAYQLLSNLQIQQGTQLASLLSVDSILYNDEAVYVWVQRQLDAGLVADDYALSTLETAFIDTIDDDQAA
ncbi:hypothetical protein [Psychrobacter sp. M13]|uniref:hypothetical protein n=1 Tax=Psychrobacter sp. M13 TaxID=3067275 RepID=UPI00273AC9B2|nr:hypothetical protein [Psychrobacter sp. M13]WLP95927.1 hypothetical protein Q9G97_13445 [Psychrobacter sp. M13]